LWDSFDDIDQDNIAELLRGKPVSGCCSHITGTNHRNFLSRTHVVLIPFA
jgi:hypothetical protein